MKRLVPFVLVMALAPTAFAGIRYSYSPSSSSTTPGGSDTQVQYNNAGAFGGITGLTSDGTSVALKNGATSAGYIDFNEDSDNGSNRVRLIGPASTADITLTLPNSDGDASQYLQTDGSGNMSWATVTAGVGGSTGSTDNAILTANGTGGSTVQASVNIIDDSGNMQLGTATSAAKGFTILDAGTYSTSGTATYGGTNNNWSFTASGLNDSGSGYPPAWVFATSSASAAYNPAGMMKIEGGGVRNYPLYLGSSYKGGVVLGRQGSSTSQIGCGLSFGYGEGTGNDTNRTSIMPIRLETGEIADPTIVNDVVTLGSASYRFKNFYGVLGNFSGNVTTAGLQLTTTTVASLGTATAGLVKAVTNAADATDCVTGGGSTFNVCVGNGSTWQDLT